MDSEEKKISDSIKNILNRNHLLTLATSKKGEPHSNAAFYTFDKNMSLYIWSEEKTTHSENLKKNRKVSVNIFDSSQKWGSLLQGLQATGIAMPVNHKEIIKAGILYIKRFPSSLKLVGNPKRFHDKLFESKIYKIQLNEIKVFDEKAFGKGGSRKISLKRRI
jgi:uncharacterized protein YhbP (UPF0306 family)